MIVILDLGNPGNTKLVRDIKEVGIYSEIYLHDITAEELEILSNVKGIIISGGSNNIVDGIVISVPPKIYEAGYPMMATGHGPAAYKRSIGSWDENNDRVSRSFVFDTCGAQSNWNIENFISDQVELIHQQMGDRKVLLALSSGMGNSTVVALLIKAIGGRPTCIYVNHGLVRREESESMIEAFEDQMEAGPMCVGTAEHFLRRLDGVTDPEQKRKVIGAEFIHIFEEEARKLEGIDFLAQETIYPDIVESGAKVTKVIKSHRNVDDLPEDLDFTLVGPLRQLFRNEIHACGLELGLPYVMVYRQPFSGPGLGVCCLGAVTRGRFKAIRESDVILREEFANTGLDREVWQYFATVPGFKSMSVRDNTCCFGYPVIIRAVSAVDTMTASVEQIDYGILRKITGRILNGVKNVNRVYYDLSPKPTAAIE